MEVLGLFFFSCPFPFALCFSCSDDDKLIGAFLPPPLFRCTCVPFHIASELEHRGPVVSSRSTPPPASAESHQQHRRLLTRTWFCFFSFLDRGHRDDRERRSRHEDGGHRDREREYSHREGHRDRDREHRDREREPHGHRDRERERHGGDRDRERYSSRRDDRRRDYGGGGGGAGGPRVEREHEEPRREDDRRREFRRDDDNRGHRRGREEGSPARRGGGGGGGRARKDAGGATPERRSPTPEGSVPLSQRRRKASGWDVHAPGYEQYSAMQAKQTGRRVFICGTRLTLIYRSLQSPWCQPYSGSTYSWYSRSTTPDSRPDIRNGHRQ